MIPFVTSNMVASKTGSYTGNNTANRAIPHRLGRVPSMVRVAYRAGYREYVLLKAGKLDYNFGATVAEYSVTAMDTVNFYVGDGVNHAQSANGAPAVLDWAAV